MLQLARTTGGHVTKLVILLNHLDGAIVEERLYRDPISGGGECRLEWPRTTRNGKGGGDRGAEDVRRKEKSCRPF